MKTKLVKTPRELAISAADEREWVKDGKFIRARVPLKELSIGCAQSLSDLDEIIIDVNKNKLSLSAAGFKPKVVVLAGGALVQSMRKKNIKTHECWISMEAAKELKLTAADQSAGLGNNQLQSELSALLSEQNKKQTTGNDYVYAYIVEVYADQKYFIYSKKGVLWKQSYNFIGKSQLVSFVGAPVRVKITYSDMAANTDTAVSMTDDEVVLKNYGAKTSEANIGHSGFMSNVFEALKMYSEAITTGTWKQQVNAAFPVPKNLIHAAADALRAKSSEGLMPADFVVMDFLRWQQQQLGASTVTKQVEGNALQASQFAVVGNAKDPSTWNIPLHTVDRVKRAYEYAQKHKTKADAHARVLAAAEQFNLV